MSVLTCILVIKLWKVINDMFSYCLKIKLKVENGESWPDINSN